MLRSPSDTLVIDAERIAEFAAKRDYDYGRDIVSVDVENDIDWIDYLLDRLFDSSDTGGGPGLAFWIVIAIMFIVTIGFYMYLKRPTLFETSGRKALAYTVEEDTIHGIDFASAISKAMQSGLYSEAVRLIYLQTLKYLSEAGRIDWQIYKTPHEYTKEVRTNEFADFTRHFLRVRYGGFAADAALCHDMQRLQGAVREKGGTT